MRWWLFLTGSVVLTMLHMSWLRVHAAFLCALGLAVSTMLLLLAVGLLRLAGQRRDALRLDPRQWRVGQSVGCVGRLKAVGAQRLTAWSGRPVVLCQARMRRSQRRNSTHVSRSLEVRGSAGCLIRTAGGAEIRLEGIPEIGGDHWRSLPWDVEESACRVARWLLAYGPGEPPGAAAEGGVLPGWQMQVSDPELIDGLQRCRSLPATGEAELAAWLRSRHCSMAEAALEENLTVCVFGQVLDSSLRLDVDPQRVRHAVVIPGDVESVSARLHLNNVLGLVLAVLLASGVHGVVLFLHLSLP